MQHLDGTSDCVDRIVINAYFILGQSGGGFRTWWRRLTGGDEHLDNTHLMRFAGRFSRRIHACAQKNNIPLIHCKPNERKHEIAQQYLPKDPFFQGVFCILVNRAPASVMRVKRFDNGQIDIRKKRPYPYVNHYSFHIMDPDWGHVTIRLCPHPPFNAKIILNGHEYVARQATKQGIGFTKEGNCFTQIYDAAGLARIADTLDIWPLASKLGAARVAGIDVNKARIRTVMQAVMALSVRPNGFSASQLAEKVKEIMGDLNIAYQTREASYDLRKLRAKDLVRKIENSRRYETTANGLRQITAFCVLREKVLIPLLAAAGKTKTAPKPIDQCKLDVHYDNIQTKMQHIFNELKLAA